MASSRRKNEKSWQTYPEKQLSPRRIGAGYLAVCVKREGRKHTYYVHRLVAEAFLGAPSDCNEVNHLDGDKSNNHISNLEWTTHSKNLQHAVANGLYGRTSLTPDQVRLIRRMLRDGASLGVTAKAVGVSKATVYGIKRGRSWSWLP